MTAPATIGQPKSTAVSWPWHLRDMTGQVAVFAGSCKFCGRDIAIPASADLGVCIYCAMDRGIITAEDEPLSEYADPVQIVTQRKSPTP